MLILVLLGLLRFPEGPSIAIFLLQGGGSGADSVVTVEFETVKDLFLGTLRKLLAKNGVNLSEAGEADQAERDRIKGIIESVIGLRFDFGRQGIVRDLPPDRRPLVEASLVIWEMTPVPVYQPGGPNLGWPLKAVIPGDPDGLDLRLQVPVLPPPAPLDGRELVRMEVGLFMLVELSKFGLAAA